MKVLQVNAVYGIGSTGTIVQHLQQACEAQGIDCYIAYSVANGEVKNGYKIGNWLSRKTHALLSRIAGKQGYYSTLSTLLFLRYVSELKPDIVHLHNLHSNFINVKLLLRYLARNDIKTVITLHDCWWYTGGCFHYTAAGCSKWLRGCGNCPKRFYDTPAYIRDASHHIVMQRERYLSDIPHLTIVGVSDWISNEARKSFFSSKSILTIYNGIDLSVFKPQVSDIRSRLGIDNKYVILGPASKWLLPINKPVFDYFVTNMEADEVLVLFGAWNRVREKPSNVIYYGYSKDKHELASLYSCADVFVNPTREDSFSLINVEAQACGTPVVTFDSTGPKETVDEINSISVPVGDYVHLYSVVKMMKAKTIEFNATDCRLFIEKRYDMNHNYRSFVCLYKTIYLCNR